jgi:hypothetical protein
MSDTDKSSIQAAAKDIISISDELTRLRQTIAQHSEAAKGLDSAATGISSLATTLRKLPEPLLALLQRGDIFIAKADQSLAPATALSETLGNYSNSFTKQQEALVQLTKLGEQNRTHLSEVNQKISLLPSSDALHALGEKIDQLAKKLASDVKLSNEKADSLQRSVERYHDTMDQAITKISGDLKFSNEKLDALQQGNQRIHESIDKLSNEVSSGLKLSIERTILVQNGIVKTNEAIIQTFKRVDAVAHMAEQQSINQDRQAQETTEKLLTLERLARRSLFAILFGRDKAETKS